MAWTPPATWTTSEVVTATKMNTHVRDNMKEVWRRLAYVEFTADVVINGPTEAAPLDIVSSGAITYTADPILIEFFANATGSGNLGINLWDATTDLGRLCFCVPNTNPSFTMSRFLTPTAASHTYKARGWVTAASCTVKAGAGGAGVFMPGYIVVWQKGGP